MVNTRGSSSGVVELYIDMNGNLISHQIISFSGMTCEDGNGTYHNSPLPSNFHGLDS